MPFRSRGTYFFVAETGFRFAKKNILLGFIAVPLCKTKIKQNNPFPAERGDFRAIDTAIASPTDSGRAFINVATYHFVFRLPSALRSDSVFQSKTGLPNGHPNFPISRVAEPCLHGLCRDEKKGMKMNQKRLSQQVR